MNEFEQRTCQAASHAAYGATGESPDVSPALKNVESYINKVIEDACRSEDRHNDVEFDYQVLPDRVLLFSIRTKYLRVQRRVLYRLHKNFEKNFGLRFNLIYPDPCRCGIAGIREEATYDILPISQGLDPNYSCLRITVFGKHYILRSLYGIRPDGELGMPHLNKLMEHGFDFEAKYPPEEEWDIFVKAYIDAYGDPPMKGALDQEKYYQDLKAQKAAKRLELTHKRQYEKDLEKYGCGYWSVCWEHGASCPCSPTAPSQQGFKEDVWQSCLKELDDINHQMDEEGI